ncbi:uncharacterized protein LOC114250975 [Bombyx mandarina]|uniref:Uncharacterized protein n=2 Tax=Bombyx TaxID=7090 RepID=A0A8R2C7H3_BOMMO|nr:uncharacterized protein LOC105842088 [Bombyx mori]XP_012548403.1 uncharacterized protein LOC105842088 [Bombyx mori]XP_028040898.1 uncharacterized protein LOC114250975 [Bombyx mandarina]
MVAAGSLSLLLPNDGGPDVVVRRLYTWVVRSMKLYRAPVWCHALTLNNVAALRRPQRAIAVRAVCCCGLRVTMRSPLQGGAASRCGGSSGVEAPISACCTRSVV